MGINPIFVPFCVDIMYPKDVRLFVTLSNKFSPKKVPMAEISLISKYGTKVLDFLASLIIKSAPALKDNEQSFLNRVHIINHDLYQVVSLLCDSVFYIALAARLLDNSWAVK